MNQEQTRPIRKGKETGLRLNMVLQQKGEDASKGRTGRRCG